MKFDIVSQQMSCAYCGMKAEPHSLQEDTDAAMADTFEVTRFTCPQCGGEMIGGDQDATAFCSFCGAANILTGRLTQEKRPGYIIPFKKTKEDCKQAYARKMRWALFAPRQLRDPAYIDSFRGIYMPYWTYKLEQKGEVCFKGKKSYRKGDYVYTEHYDLTGNVDAAYYGFSYDASSTFYDNISESLALGIRWSLLRPISAVSMRISRMLRRTFTVRTPWRWRTRAVGSRSVPRKRLRNII